MASFATSNDIHKAKFLSAASLCGVAIPEVLTSESGATTYGEAEYITSCLRRLASLSYGSSTLGAYGEGEMQKAWIDTWLEFVETDDYYEAHKIESELIKAGHDAWIADGLLEIMAG